jgi:predicted nucleic acid-binding protein
VTIVIDASVALKWVLDEPGAVAADALLSEDLIAPGLWLVEAANALWRRVRRHEITADQAKSSLTELHNAPVATVASDIDLDAALRLAIALDHPVYDCLYLAMAVREGAHMITADRRLHAAAEKASDLKGVVRLLDGDA